jgi:hypothetical protein
MKATFCIILLVFSYSFISILAHTFTPNESASFISLGDQINSASMPILQYDSPNVTAIKEQVRHTRMPLTDALPVEEGDLGFQLETQIHRPLSHE